MEKRQMLKMKERFRGRKVRNRLKRMLALLLVVAVSMTSLGVENFAPTVQAATAYTTLYLADDTAEGWIGDAVIELVDNTYGHDRYIMTQVNDRLWSVRVPESTYNVTFNRYDPTKTTQWNSWSAGGRDTHNAYHVLGLEYGYWDGTAELEEGFHVGDVVYLDFYEFTDWGGSDALFYVNYTDASKEDNGGNDITISSADSGKYAPILLTEEIEDDVFTYTVTEEEEGATELRFWRGNADTLWNCSVTLSYKDYKAGNNCAKIQGWNDEGYVCPYVPRRHVPVIDTMEFDITGNRKVNRKITIDLLLEGETDLLNLEDTVITIEKEVEDDDGTENDSGEEASDTSFLLYDESKTTWNHRELLFTEPGTYHITAVATDGTDEFTTDTYITVVKDEAPVADFDFNCEEGNVYLRDETGTAKVTVTDVSVSELGDTINNRIYTLYHDANADGVFGEEEKIGTKEGNELSVSYDLTAVGNYMVILSVQETFEDTIPELLDESAYLSDDTTDRQESTVVFEITNQAPTSSMSMEKSKTADIVFTVGNAEEEILSQYTAATQKVQERLKEMGIDAKVSTVSTSALTAQDTFAWTEYDHYNYQDMHLPTMEKHILYEGNDIKMMGYSQSAVKDFLFVDDKDDSVKVFEFDLQRDGTDWHSMEGGGFLFNTIVNTEHDYIKGYCVLVTQSGLQIIQMRQTGLENFRNGYYWKIQYVGNLLQTFPIEDVYGEHHFKIIVDKNTITIYDGATLVVENYVVPDDGVEAYGYGPITSHYAHNCSQQSYFTFKNITMQTITGESLSDVVNSHEWTPGTNHYVINLSETSVPELSDHDPMV